MAKVAFYLSLFCAAASAASLIGWLVALAPAFHALAAWLVVALVLTMITLIMFDDGVRALVGAAEDNAYYGAIAGGFVAILLGLALIWICN